MPRIEKTKTVDPSKLKGNSLISRAQAVQLIADRTCGDDDSDKQDRHKQARHKRARNRVNKRIGDQSKRKTSTVPKMIGGKYVFGELAAWAQDTWPDQFNDWPATRVSMGEIESTLDGVSAEFRAVQLPKDLLTCHSRIIELENKLAAVYRENESLRSQVVELRGIIASDEESRRKRQKAARGPRGPRIK